MAKAKKWAWLRGAYPTLTVSEDTKSESVTQQIMALHQGASLSALAEKYNTLCNVKDGLDEELKGTNAEIEGIRRLLNDSMDTQDMESVTIAGYRFVRMPEPYPKVVDAAKLRAWATTHMPDNLAIPWQTLRSTVKADLTAEIPRGLPDGIEVYLKEGISRTKAE